MDRVNRYLSQLPRERLEFLTRTALWISFVEGLGLAFLAFMMAAS